MANSLAVRFFRETVPDTPDKKSAEMPPGGPQYGGLHPGGKDTPLPGRRYPRGMRNVPWRSWLQQGKRPGVKTRKRKRSSLQALMG